MERLESRSTSVWMLPLCCIIATVVALLIQLKTPSGSAYLHASNNEIGPRCSDYNTGSTWQRNDSILFRAESRENKTGVHVILDRQDGCFVKKSVVLPTQDKYLPRASDRTPVKTDDGFNTGNRGVLHALARLLGSDATEEETTESHILGENHDDSEEVDDHDGAWSHDWHEEHDEL